MAENGTYYVRLVNWNGGNAGMGSFTYDICAVADDEVLQTITIERDVKVLRVADWKDILLHPETYISFEDLNRDGADDLKILSENGGGQGEPVYIAFLWDKDQGLFVEGVPEEGGTPWIWIGGAAVVAVGGILLWRKRKGKERA